MLLFSAPQDFDYNAVGWWTGIQECPSDTWMGLREWWWNTSVTEWVCNPKQNFIVEEDVLQRFPNLNILATPSTGLNHIDLDACKRRGVKVLSLLDDRAGLDTISASAEFTFKLLLDALRIPPARELQGKTVGLVGYGRIGRKLADWFTAFGAMFYLNDPRMGNLLNNSLTHIFKNSDAVIICCSLTPETTGMIDAPLLRSMKHGAALINTARGEIINERDLLTVMDERPDLRIALDVLTGEVTGTANPAPLKARGAIITNHIAGETFDSRTKAARIILNLLKKELGNEKTKETGRDHV